LVTNVKTAVRQAGRVISHAFFSDDNDVEAAGILDTLKREHDEVRDLLEDLADAETPAQRRTLVQKIKAALVPHTKAEEKVVYDAVIALRDKDAQRFSKNSSSTISRRKRGMWSDVKRNFSDEQRRRMNVEFEAAKRKVKP
jgi:hemerythrin superfamily protein